MRDNLVTWLTNQIETRGWSLRELARRSGLSHATISNVLSGQSNPGFDFCTGIAKALGESPQTVLRLAGLLPEVSADKARQEELLAWFDGLSDEDQDYALLLVKTLGETRKREQEEREAERRQAKTRLATV